MLPEVYLHFSEGSGELNDLITATHEYFPIGFDIKNEAFPGHKKLLEITKQKFTRIYEHGNPENLDQLQNEIKLLFSENLILNEFGLEFPNYSISIFISESETSEIKTKSVLKIKISLLVNYYTVYFEETISYKNEDLTVSPPIRHVTLSSGSKLAPLYKNPTKEVKEIVEKAFSTYRFADPRLLFTFKVKAGFPHQYQDIPLDYCIFDFLFDNEYVLVKNKRYVLTQPL